MKQTRFSIDGIPVILWWEASGKAYLYVHGQGGNKEEAAAFAQTADERGWQVLSLDLPEHGERREGKEPLVPWQAVPELKRVIRWLRDNGKQRVALRATSIGAWFALLGLADEALERCLLVSPVVDMERVIQTMMGWAGVSEEQLQARQVIPTSFGQNLSWEYLAYVRQHSITRWEAPTHILYAGRDNLTARPVMEDFARRFGCEMMVMENGEHWFHTPEQLAVLEEWTKNRC